MQNMHKYFLLQRADIISPFVPAECKAVAVHKSSVMNQTTGFIMVLFMLF